MKRFILLILALGLVTFGCITGEMRHNVQGDGTDIAEVEFDKAGLLEDADCDTVKELIVSLDDEMSDAEKQRLEGIPCEDKEESLLLTYTLPLGDSESPVSVVSRDGKEHLRFEDVKGPLKVIVNMPTKITSTNGDLVDERTAEFGAVDFTDPDASMDEIIYVESEKPSGLCPLPVVLLGGLGFAAFVLSRR